MTFETFLREFSQVKIREAKTLPEYDRWKNLKSIGTVMLTRLCQGIETTEIRYYISSLDVGVKLFARAVRGHWVTRCRALDTSVSDRKQFQEVKRAQIIDLRRWAQTSSVVGVMSRLLRFMLGGDGSVNVRKRSLSEPSCLLSCQFKSRSTRRQRIEP